MRISIFCCGYVGLVTGACFAQIGHEVFCTDIDQSRIETLCRGGLPIYEVGLNDLVAENVAAGRALDSLVIWEKPFDLATRSSSAWVLLLSAMAMPTSAPSTGLHA